MSLLDLVSKTHELTPSSGGDSLILCPFHSDSRPSCRVNDKRYKCFACGEYGDSISWLRKIHGMTYGEACKQLGKQLVSTKKKERPHSKVEFGAEYLKCLVDFNNIVTSSLAGEQCPRITDANKFSVGDGDVIGGRYAGRWTIPIRNMAGWPVGVSARAKDDNPLRYLDPCSCPTFKKQRLLFGGHLARKVKGDLVIVEGFFDAIAYGVGAVALMGCVCSDAQYELLEYYFKDRRIVVALDNDMPGIRSSMTIMKELNRRGFDVWYAPAIERYKDYGEMGADCKLIKRIKYYGDRLMTGFELTEATIKKAQRFVDANIKAGYPHLNVLDSALYIYDDMIEESNRLIRESNIDKLLVHWVKICQRVREENNAKKD